MHNKVEEIKNKKFDWRHMLGSFAGGFLVAVLVVYGVSGTQSQGFLRLTSTDKVASLNPSALSPIKNGGVQTTPNGTCSVSNCDINAKLDLILNQLTLKDSGNKALSQYLAQQFTEVHNQFQYLAGQFTESDNVLTNIKNNVVNSFQFMGTQFTVVNDKLDMIKTTTDTTVQYFWPNIFTDMMNKLDAILAK